MDWSYPLAHPHIALNEDQLFVGRLSSLSPLSLVSSVSCSEPFCSIDLIFTSMKLDLWLHVLAAVEHHDPQIYSVYQATRSKPRSPSCGFKDNKPSSLTRRALQVQPSDLSKPKGHLLGNWCLSQRLLQIQMKNISLPLCSQKFNQSL